MVFFMEGSILAQDERWRFGVTKMSAGVSTAVGGHTLKNAGTAQFDINDESSVEEIINMIKSVGYQPILKDWERI